MEKSHYFNVMTGNLSCYLASLQFFNALVIKRPRCHQAKFLFEAVNAQREFGPCEAARTGAIPVRQGKGAAKTANAALDQILSQRTFVMGRV